MMAQTHHRHRTSLGFLWGLIAVLIWAGWLVLTSAGRVTNLAVIDLTGFRALIPALVLAPLLWRERAILRQIGIFTPAWPVDQQTTSRQKCALISITCSLHACGFGFRETFRSPYTGWQYRTSQHEGHEADLLRSCLLSPLSGATPDDRTISLKRARFRNGHPSA